LNILQPLDLPDLVTLLYKTRLEQAADYLQISSSSIRWDIRQGTLKAFRIADLRKVLIPRAELLTLLQLTSFSDG
jgi:excisionase family DNA binding protein